MKIYLFKLLVFSQYKNYLSEIKNVNCFKIEIKINQTVNWWPQAKIYVKSNAEIIIYQ